MRYENAVVWGSVLAVLGAACDGRAVSGGVATGSAGAGGSIGIGGGGGTSGGTAGADGGAAPCTGAADPRLVVAPQRLLRLTMIEVVYSIASLVDPAIASSFVGTGANAGNYDIGDETTWGFPPLNAAREGEQIDDTKLAALDAIAQTVGQYVLDNFPTVTKCATPGTDDCATAYVQAFAESAYRRPLTADEQGRVSALYATLRSSVVDRYLVTSTVEEATGSAVCALLSTPQFLYRSELGDPAAPLSTSPPGVLLTPYELATELSFYLSNSPPDQTLLDEARAGTLAADLPAQVDRLLATQPVRDWLRTVMTLYFKINLLPQVASVIDPSRFPNLNAQLLADMGVEANMFLDDTLWNGPLSELLTSTRSFINSNLATNLYGVPVPAGAATFVQTALPPGQRSGLLTNAAFLTSRARSAISSIVSRGLLIQETFVCLPVLPEPDDPSIANGEVMAAGMLPTETSQQQVAVRASMPACWDCHQHFDPYGLALENYDPIATYRTVDDMGMPIDAHATLPPEVGGGGAVANAIDLGHALATSPAVTACLAKSVLQYALTDLYTAPVELPSPPGWTPSAAGCAAADVARRFGSAATMTFGDLVRTAATAPAFSIRAPAAP